MMVPVLVPPFLESGVHGFAHFPDRRGGPEVIEVGINTAEAEAADELLVMEAARSVTELDVPLGRNFSALLVKRHG
jgi:hypothetical protein